MIYDVVIAGGGPVGLFLACELRLANLSVLVLEEAEDPRSLLKRLPFGMRGLSAPTIEAFHRRRLLNDIAAPHRGQSGKVYWYVEYSDDELSELPDNIDDREKYVKIPNKKELDLGKPLVLEFVRQIQPSEMDKVQRIFSAKGAYARFKDLMDRPDCLHRIVPLV